MSIRNISLEYYRSTVDGTKLAMEIYWDNVPRPPLVYLHGFSNDLTHVRQLVLQLEMRFFSDFTVINPDMRGRTFSEGLPDLNLLELQDVVDAVSWVANNAHYQDTVTSWNRVFLAGHSGGGGNVLAMLARYPRVFTRAWAACPISDYARWFRETTPRHRQEMLTWVGSTPEEGPLEYQRRSGLYLLEDLSTPLLILHGAQDQVVSVEHSRRYVTKARKLGKPVKYIELPNAGHAPLLTTQTKRKIKQFLFG